MIDLVTITNKLRGAVISPENQHFTDEQKVELLDIIDKVDVIYPQVTMNPFKMAKVLEAFIKDATTKLNNFELKYIEYKGNQEILEVIKKDIQDESIPMLKSVKAKLNKIGFKWK